MSEDISEKLQQLKEMLNNNQLPDNLKNVMSLMSNSPQQSSSSENSQNNSFTNNSSPEILITKVKRIIDKKKQDNDPRMNLLSSLRPYLSQKRQERVDSCIKFMDIAFLSKILKDEDW